MSNHFSPYEQNVYHQSVHGDSGSRLWSKIFQLISFNRFLLLRGYFRPNGKILEIGSGPGWNLHYFENFNISAVEPSPLYNSYYKQKNIRLYKSLEGISGTYSQILLSHVLEHVENPLQFLIQIRSLLSAGNPAEKSQLIMLLPNEASGILGKQSRKQDQHLYCFNKITISNLLERAGYQSYSIRSVPYGYELFIAKTIFAKLHLSTPLKILYVIFLRIFQSLLMKSQYFVVASCQ